MKINYDNLNLYNKVSPALAEAIQPMIVDTIKSYKINQDLLQGALLKVMETEGVPPTHLRDGKAILTRVSDWSKNASPTHLLSNDPAILRMNIETAQRLLKDPLKLVADYRLAKDSFAASKAAIFEDNLKKMVEHSSPNHPAKTLQEIKQKFPDVRDVGRLNTIATLHAQNEGRPLTLVPVNARQVGSNVGDGMWDVTKRTPIYYRIADSERINGQMTDNLNLILLDGESLVMKPVTELQLREDKQGAIIVVVDTKDLENSLNMDPMDIKDTNLRQAVSLVKLDHCPIISAPAKPQVEIATPAKPQVDMSF